MDSGLSELEGSENERMLAIEKLCQILFVKGTEKMNRILLEAQNEIGEHINKKIDETKENTNRIQPSREKSSGAALEPALSNPDMTTTVIMSETLMKEEWKNLGLELRRVEGDGNCFYNAFSEILGSDPVVWREMFITNTFLSKESINYFEDIHDFTDYLRLQAKNGVWADSLVISQGFNNLFKEQLCLIVYKEIGAGEYIRSHVGGENFKACLVQMNTIYLLNTGGGDGVHFDALVPTSK